MVRLTLHTKLVILLIGAALIPLAVVSVVTLVRFQATLETEASRFGRELGAAAATEIEAFMLSQLSLLEYLSVIYHPEFPVRTNTADAILENVLYKSENFIYVSIVDQNGRERARKSRLSVIEAEDLRTLGDTPHYLAVKEQGVYFGPVYSEQGKIFFDIGRAMIDSRGKFAGAAFAQVDAKVMPLVMENISKIAGEGGRVYIVDETGKVIAHPDISYMLAEKDLSSLPPVQGVKGGRGTETTSEIYVNETGVEVLGSAYPLTIELFDQRSSETFRINWYVVNEQLTSLVFGEAAAARNFALIVSFLVVALAGASAFFLGIRISRPIEALHTAALEFGKGNLGYRASVISKDEIGELAESFNLMAERLSLSIASLKREEEVTAAERNKLSIILSGVTNAVIAVDSDTNVILLNRAAESLVGLTARSVFGKPLGHAFKLFDGDKELSVDEYCPPQKDSSYEGPVFEKKGLRLIGPSGERYVNLVSGQIHEGIAVNLRCIVTMQDITREFALEKTKREFVSVAAHQLRTPLTGITWALDGLLADVGESYKRVVKDTLLAARRMTAIVNGLLDVSRIEEGRFGAKLEIKPIIPVFTSVRETFSRMAKEKNIELLLTVPENLPEIPVDEEKLEMALGNIVDNAIRYTLERGRIAISASASKEALLISVIDSGIGISKEEAPRIFTKFFRSPRAQLLFTDGSGLGLYIAKNIVEQHGGKLWFESAENKGTTFFISLPIPKRGVDSKLFTVPSSASLGTMNAYGK